MAYTDTAAGQTDAIPESEAQPGDIVFFRYDDPDQPYTIWPHMGLVYNADLTLDCRYPAGCGIHPMLATARDIHRVRR